MTQEQIAEIIRREIRLVPAEGENCEECGDWLGTWRVKDGCIERIAALISNGENVPESKE